MNNDFFCSENQVNIDDRIREILEGSDWPDELETLFTGEVKVVVINYDPTDCDPGDCTTFQVP